MCTVVIFLTHSQILKTKCMAWGRLWITNSIGVWFVHVRNDCIDSIFFWIRLFCEYVDERHRFICTALSQHTQICGPHSDDVCLMFDKNSISKISKVPCTQCTSATVKTDLLLFTFLSISLLRIAANEFNQNLVYARWFVYYYLLLPLLFIQNEKKGWMCSFVWDCVVYFFA